MRAFACPVCSSLIFFENSRCLHCSTALAFSWAQRTTVGAAPPESSCANAAIAACNWTVAALVGDDATLARCRALFGDEREDYGEALERHYEHGAPADWPQHTVSAYASMHPWEDWAETFAQLLHIRDALQTAGSYGVSVRGPVRRARRPASSATSRWTRAWRSPT